MSISNSTFIKFTRREQKAIEKVYLEYKNLMYFVIASYISNKCDVEDVLSDSFIKAVDHRLDIKEPEKLKSFLSTIAKNTALDFLRKQREIPSSDVIDEIYADDDRSNNLLSMLEPLLTNKETIVTYLKVGFSYTWEEIASETGLSIASARRIYEKAKEKLRKGLL